MKALATLAYLVPLFGNSQVDIFLPDDPHPNGQFGSAIAVDGDTLLIGSSGGPVFGLTGSPVIGSVYVFNATTGEQIRELRALDGEDQDRFGHSVALDGTIALIGAPYEDELGIWAGAAYVFDVTTGEQLHKLLPTQYPVGRFGSDVAISGETLLVGAWGDTEIAGGAGAAYVFDAISGVLLHKLLPADSAQAEEFGYSVALSGTTALIGCPHDGNGNHRGAAYLFDTTTGSQIMKIVADDPLPFVEYGHSVAVDGGLGLIGAIREDSLNNNNGAAYLIDLTTGEQLAKWVANDPGAEAWFGAAVAIRGDTAIVGAPGLSGSFAGNGSAYIFDVATGAQVARLRAPNTSSTNQFGYQVEIDDEDVFISSRISGVPGVPGGVVRVFDATPEPDNPGSAACFGDGSGTPCPCANGDPEGGCPTSTSQGAQMSSVGNARFSASTFGLVVTNLPPGKPGLCVRGSILIGGGAGNPVGDGLLCTSPQLRSQVIVSSPGGVVNMDSWRGSTFATFPGVATGGAESIYQWWFRDADNGCTGAGFNFSNAWAVSWME